MPHTDLPDHTIDARSLGYVPSDGALVRDTPFLTDVLRQTRRSSLWWAWGAPVFALLALGALVDDLWFPALLALVGLLLRWGWVLWRLPYHPKLAAVADVPIRSVPLAGDDIVLTRWVTAVRVDAPAGAGWAYGLFPRAHRELLLRHRRVHLVARPGSRRVLLLIPGSLAVLGARLRDAPPARVRGAHPSAPPRDHLVSAVPASDEVFSLWVRAAARNTLVLAGLAVALGAAMGTSSLLPLLDSRPGGDPIWNVLGLLAAVASVLWSLQVARTTVRLRRRYRRARAWVSLPARVDAFDVDGPGRYTITATVWHPDGRAEQICASGTPVDLVAAVVDTGRLWILDSTVAGSMWAVGVPGHPVVALVGHG